MGAAVLCLLAISRAPLIGSVTLWTVPLLVGAVVSIGAVGAVGAFGAFGANILPRDISIICLALDVIGGAGDGWTLEGPDAALSDPDGLIIVGAI